MSKHTISPWEREGNRIVSNHKPKVRFGDQLEFKRSFVVCQPALYTDPVGKELEANIRLMTAAPDMLEALRGVQFLNGVKPLGVDPAAWEDSLDRVDRAIKKATGSL
jgi:hypothetical protein